MTPFLAHSTPFRSHRSLSKVSTNSGEAQTKADRLHGPEPRLISRPREPCVLPLLDLIGQSLESCGHAQEPLPYFRVSRLDSECPQHCCSLQVFPRPRLLVGHYQQPGSPMRGLRSDRFSTHWSRAASSRYF